MIISAQEVAENQHQAIRKKLWSEAYVAFLRRARADRVYGESASGEADQALKCFDQRFSTGVNNEAIIPKRT